MPEADRVLPRRTLPPCRSCSHCRRSSTAGCSGLTGPSRPGYDSRDRRRLAVLARGPLPGEAGAPRVPLWRRVVDLHDRYRRPACRLSTGATGRHRRRPGGGEDIQAPRLEGPQLIAALAALVCEAGLAAFPLLRAGTLRGLVLAAGAVALALLLLALAGFVGSLPWSLGLVAAEFVLVDTARSESVLRRLSEQSCSCGRACVRPREWRGAGTCSPPCSPGA
jgi:hypothetical protein